MTPKTPPAFSVSRETRNRRRIVLLTLLSPAVFFLVQPVIAQPLVQSSNESPVGFIASVQGSWISSRTRASLGPVDPVFAGERIAPKMPSFAGDVILIALYDGTKTSLRCRSASDCDAAYQVPIVHKADSFLSRVTQAIRQLYPTQVNKFFIAASRGSSGPKPTEAVIKVEKDGVPDLGPALTSVEPGSYTAQLSPMHDQDAESSVISGTLNWSPPAADWKSASPVTPGLYRLVLTDTKGGVVGSEAVVIIQARPEYKKFHQAFARFNQTAESWKAADNTQDIRGLRIGFLIALWRDPALAE
jgi:hypothetical protein